MTYSKELNERSPLRVFERSIHGGVGEGKVGVVCASAGVGKSAFLVGIALDYLMRGHQVLHIAQDQPVDRVRNYYDEIFAELARSEQLEDAAEVRVRIEQNRRIHTYQEHSFDIGGLDRTLKFLRTHTDIRPRLMILDDYDWAEGSPDDINELKRIAHDQQAELWMSVRTQRGAEHLDEHGYPKLVSSYVPFIDVVVQLKTADGAVHLTVLKDHGLERSEPVGVDLDPTTLLLVKR